jgi:hypothetical protein
MEREKMGLHSVFYITITDYDSDDLDIDGPYFGGVADDEIAAERIARSLTNDKSLPGVVITKKFNNGSLKEMQEQARKQFYRLSDEMSDAHKTIMRSRKKRKL